MVTKQQNSDNNITKYSNNIVHNEKEEQKSPKKQQTGQLFSYKGKGICLESRYLRYKCSSDFTFPLAVGAYGSLQLSIQPWICAPGTHYGWVDRGSVEYEVCPTLLHMASTGNRTPDLLILSPTPYPLGHMLPVIVMKTSLSGPPSYMDHFVRSYVWSM